MTPVVEPVVNREKLLELLAEGAESEALEFKGKCDLDSREDVVHLAAEFAAMQILPDGGYIVVGVDDQGERTCSIAESDVAQFDPARVHDKLRKYIPEPFAVLSQVHEIDDCRVALIYAGPAEDCFTVFAANGSFDENGKTVTRFKKGDVFARHGTKSELWNQADVDRVRDCLRAKEREKLAQDMEPFINRIQAGRRASEYAEGPAGALDWRIDANLLADAVIEQLRRQDDVALRLLLKRLPRDAADLFTAERDEEQLNVLLDRLATLMGVFVTLEDRPRFDMATKSLAAIYTLGFDERGRPRSELGRAVSAPHLWLLAIERAEAVGALAVRQDQWAMVRELVLRPTELAQIARYGTWLRQGVTEASRASLFRRENVEGQEVDFSLLALARKRVEENDWLHPDTPAEDEAVTSSLCQFDFATALIAIDRVGSIGVPVFYPSFARFYTERVEPLVLRLIVGDSEVRDAVFPQEDDDLADALRGISGLAGQEAFRYEGWYGYEDQRILKFLEEHPPTTST